MAAVATALVSESHWAHRIAKKKEECARERATS